MLGATISGDIISFTSLSGEDKERLVTELKGLLNRLSDYYRAHHFYGRLVQGDYIECALSSPKYVLRIALLLKTFIKSFNISLKKSQKKQLKYFYDYGIRLAVAVAPIDKIDPEEGIIDGQAIYLSGRKIKSLSTSGKEKIRIKTSMFFLSSEKELQDQMGTLFSLLDSIISGYSSKQSEVVFYKLLNQDEKEISEKLKKAQSTISQHSTAANWSSVEKTVNYFENYINKCF